MLAVDIDRPLYRASLAEAEQSTAAYTLLVDLSRKAPVDSAAAAEWQTWLATKQFPGSCPVAVNDVSVASGPLLVDRESIAASLARVSKRYALRAGDLVGICPPRSEFAVRLRVGDHVKISLNASMQLSFDIASGG